MSLISLILDIFLILSIVCCLIVITSTNPVIAIIYLIGVFINAALYLIFIGLGFIGISYIIVYIGAITVLFLFVIMLLNIDLIETIETGNQYSQNLPLVVTISGLLILGFFSVYSTNENNF
jgi:NADH-ubiquinone oxidoreductase chain 6